MANEHEADPRSTGRALDVVDARQFERAGVDAELLEHLSPRCFIRALAGLEHAARRGPQAPSVGLVNQQDEVVTEDEDPTRQAGQSIRTRRRLGRSG
jgi:hypothetical protein